MRLSVLTRSSTSALIAVEAARARLLSATDTSQDALLADLIAGASQAMEDAFGVPFARQRYELQLAGNGKTRITLPDQFSAVPVDPSSFTATIDGEAVTDFSVVGPCELYRSSGWTRPWDSDLPLNVVLTFRAGWVLPDQVQTWAPGAEVEVGGWVRPPSPADSPLLFEVADDGTLGSTEPEWGDAAAGDEVDLDGATAIAREAEELPPSLTALAFVEVHARLETRSPGVASETAEGFSTSYFATQTDMDLQPATRAGLDRLRMVACA